MLKNPPHRLQIQNVNCDSASDEKVKLKNGSPQHILWHGPNREENLDFRVQRMFVVLD